MSAVIPSPEHSPPFIFSAPPTTSSRAAMQRQRVLACVLCQQRKVKCDRKFPCANCVKASAQCVPASLIQRQRRRRFPERELLERLRSYESLLRQNNIQFEPLHTPAAEKTSPSENDRRSGSPDDTHSEGPVGRTDRPARKKTTVKSRTLYGAKSIWSAMNQRSGDPDSDNDNGDDDGDENDGRFPHDDVLRKSVVKKAFDQAYESGDHFLFGSRKKNVNLSNLHPEQVQIFKLWQIYLDNVNPLLKVTHTTTLQARIIDAASDVAAIHPTLEALMFSIYCVSIQSLDEVECRLLCGSPKEDLLKGYQAGCQQALLNCGILRSGDRDCLTALYLYLISVRLDTDPRSLSSMLGVAIRIAQRMGIHIESTNAKWTALEAEMRRRLWWSLIIFDHRIGELSDNKTAMLVPTWDCKTPLNVNDCDLQPEMKTLPTVNKLPTEALFAAVRSELCDFVRHSAFYLDFTNPSLKPIAKDTQPGSKSGELTTLEKSLENNYFQFCNPENSLHFMTIWTTRGYIAKTRLLEHYSRHSGSFTEQTEMQRDIAISHALRILECDTKLMASPLTKGFLWLIRLYFPMPAYIHIIQDLRKRPFKNHAEKIWEVMNDNYEARFMSVEQGDNPLFKLFAKTILGGWEALETASKQSDKPLEPPRIIRDIKDKLMLSASGKINKNISQPNGVFTGMNIDHLSMPMSVDFGGMTYEIGAQDYPNIPELHTLNVDLNPLNWTAMDWNPIHDWNPMYAQTW